MLSRHFCFLDSNALCNSKRHSIWLNVYAASIVGVLPTYICCTHLHVYSHTTTRSLALDKNPTSSLGSRGCGPDSAIMRAKRQIHLSMLQRARCTRGLPPVGAAPGWTEKRSAVEIGNPVAADCAILPPASLVVPWP